MCSLAYYNRAVCYQHVGAAKDALRDYGVVLLLEKEMNQKVGGEVRVDYGICSQK